MDQGANQEIPGKRVNIFTTYIGEVYKLLIPPIAQILIRKVKRRIMKLGTDSSKLSYDNPELAHYVTSKNVAFRESLKDNQILKDHLVSMLGVIVAGINREKLNVIDFGGGGGHLQAIACRTFPTKKFSWVVVETQAMCDIAGATLSSSELIYTSTLQEAIELQKTNNLVISSSSLQYTSNPLTELQSLVNVEAEYLFIDKTPLLGNGSQISYFQESLLSSNGPGSFKPKQFRQKLIKYRNTICPRLEFESILKSKYEIILHIEEGNWDYERFGSHARTHGYLCKKRGLSED